MKKKKDARRKFSWKNLVIALLAVLSIILIFTFVDFLIHQLSEEYAVPGYYFRNKIIFGTGIGFVSYLFVRKKKLIWKSLIFSAVISVLLQIRYFLEGFSIKFVLEFLVYHFLILFFLSYFAFRLIKI